MLGENVAVYDYKTGHTTASLVEIVSGLKLQLLTYLLGLMEEADGNPLLPAALMYIYLSAMSRSSRPCRVMVFRTFRPRTVHPALSLHRVQPFTISTAAQAVMTRSFLSA